MVVLHLTNCPPALRGDITKWLMEIAQGVYVGRVSARVRDKLWERVVETCKSGRAVLVFSAKNEQRMDFRIHGETWEPIDFDGLKLMLRPTPARLAANRTKQGSREKLGFSDASGFHRAKKYSKNYNKNIAPIIQQTEKPAKVQNNDLSSYVVVDFETTGLSPTDCEIIEIGAIRVNDGKIVDKFQSYVRIKVSLPTNIIALTGITDDILADYGKPLNSAIESLVVFLQDLPIVAHNAPFDISFLNAALRKCGNNQLPNHAIDTLKLAKKADRKFTSYKLKNLAEEFCLDFKQMEQHGYKLHSSLGDCYLTHLLYQKLINFDEQVL